MGMISPMCSKTNSHGKNGSGLNSYSYRSTKVFCICKIIQAGREHELAVKHHTEWCEALNGTAVRPEFTTTSLYRGFDS